MSIPGFLSVCSSMLWLQPFFLHRPCRDNLCVPLIPFHRDCLYWIRQVSLLPNTQFAFSFVPHKSHSSALTFRHIYTILLCIDTTRSGLRLPQLTSPSVILLLSITVLPGCHPYFVSVIVTTVSMPKLAVKERTRSNQTNRHLFFLSESAFPTLVVCI